MKFRSLLKFSFLTLLIHLILYGFYLITSVGIPDKTVYLQMRRYIPCALLISFSICMWKKFQFPVIKLWPHSLVFFAWMLTYPLCYWIPYHLNINFIDNHYDIAASAYIFCFTVCLHLLLLRFLNNSSKITFIISSVQTLLMVIPVAQLLYFAYYKTPISPAA